MAVVDGKPVTAELAILALELGAHESGVWLNSRGRTSGVIDLMPVRKAGKSTFRTIRKPIPLFVAALLEQIYCRAQLAKGCPDLAIWRGDSETLRLVEVKCPHWDRPSPEQHRFMAEAARSGVPTKVVEWEFEEGAT